MRKLEEKEDKKYRKLDEKNATFLANSAVANVQKICYKNVTKILQKNNKFY